MFIDHVFAKAGLEKQGPRPGFMYEYLMASNGLFIRAQRPGLQVQIPIMQGIHQVKGLLAANLVVNLSKRIPTNMLQYLIRKSRECLPNEQLFYLDYAGEWRVVIPRQTVSPTRCAPVESFSEAARNCIVEVHSHNTMGAFFSGEDDRDETGFKIYVVLGMVHTAHPQIAVRVGIYGHHCIVPADMVFCSPYDAGLEDSYGIIE